jgi:multiple sugar transport system permease protein
MTARRTITSSVTGFLSVVISLVWVFPLYWAVNTAFTVDEKTAQIPPSWFPVPILIDAFAYVIKNTAIIRWYVNSVITSVAITAAVLLLTMMCGYALSQMKFRGRQFVYVGILAGFMIPAATNVVPLFMFMNKLGMVNTYWGIILPQLAAPIAVVIYKQFFDQMPLELSDAARMDGGTDLRILFRLFLPLNWGVTWALAIILFIGAWNNFFWPFIVIGKTPMMTITVGITQVQSWYGIAYPRQMASAVLAALPTAILFVIFQRRVAQGVAITSGIK